MYRVGNNATNKTDTVTLIANQDHSFNSFHIHMYSKRSHV